MYIKTNQAIIIRDHTTGCIDILGQDFRMHCGQGIIKKKNDRYVITIPGLTTDINITVEGKNIEVKTKK